MTIKAPDMSWSMRESDRGEVVRRVGVSLTTSRRMCLTATASFRLTICSPPAAGSPRTRASWVLGRYGLCTVGLRLCGPQTQRAEHATWSDCLGAALLLAALAPAVRLAMLRTASLSSLGAAQVLAAPAATMRRAGTRVASSCLEAALLLAPSAPAVRHTGARVA